MKKIVLSIALLFLGPYSFAGNISWGQSVQVGNGWARSYIKMDATNNPMELGIVWNGAALEGLPDLQHEYDFLLPMPTKAAIPPYKHVMLNWNPHGHDPYEIYGAPHFDFHFYTISNEDRQKITCSGADEPICMKTPEPDFIPPHYAPTPAGVPQMGWHWFDTRSPEFNGQPFTSTLIYGFYAGQIAFIEPMMARDFLLTHASNDFDIPLPMKVKESGFYPSRYSLHYDSVKDLFSVSINKFMKIEM